MFRGASVEAVEHADLKSKACTRQPQPKQQSTTGTRGFLMTKTLPSELPSPSLPNALPWVDPVDQPDVVDESDQDSLWDQFLAARGEPTDEVTINPSNPIDKT
jgi:hypothetical protein